MLCIIASDVNVLAATAGRSKPRHRVLQSSARSGRPGPRRWAWSRGPHPACSVKPTRVRPPSHSASGGRRACARSRRRSPGRVRGAAVRRHAARASTRKKRSNSRGRCCSRDRLARCSAPPRAPARPRLGRDLHRHLRAGLGETDRVAEQVGDRALEQRLVDRDLRVAVDAHVSRASSMRRLVELDHLRAPARRGSPARRAAPSRRGRRATGTACR